VRRECRCRRECRWLSEKRARGRRETAHRRGRRKDAVLSRERWCDRKYFQVQPWSAWRIRLSPSREFSGAARANGEYVTVGRGHEIGDAALRRRYGKRIGSGSIPQSDGTAGGIAKGEITVSPLPSACMSGAPITDVTSGCGAGSYVGVLAVMFNCPRQPLHAPEELPSPLSPTNTVEAFVAVTRAGPELANPATPPTATLVSGVAGWFGSAR
jgi:hypothetical protein